MQEGGGEGMKIEEMLDKLINEPLTPFGVKTVRTAITNAFTELQDYKTAFESLWEYCKEEARQKIKLLKRIAELEVDLKDFEFVCCQVSKVYCHITNDKLSKPNYYADVVIREADDYETALFEERLKEETEELTDRIKELEDFYTRVHKLEYVAGIVKPYEHKIKELEGQINSMRCCGNCKHSEGSSVDYSLNCQIEATFVYGSGNCDKWE